VILRPESGSIANLMDQVKQHLAKNLPEYMVPSNIIDLTEFPYSNNHKIDKNKLIEWHLQGKVK
jgi:D-alanine--poly(phosphoribitol) ligase subunit 1